MYNVNQKLLILFYFECRYTESNTSFGQIKNHSIPQKIEKTESNLRFLNNIVSLKYVFYLFIINLKKLNIVNICYNKKIWYFFEFAKFIRLKLKW